MYLSIIIPAYNEEKNIKATIQDIYSYLKNESIDHEIIIVVNGSKDRTAEIVKESRSSIPTLELVELKIGAKGLAVREGMLKARGEYRLFTDADNSTTMDHIKNMMPYFSEGYEVVIASIAVKGSDIVAGSEPLWRRVFGKLGNLFIQIMAVPGIHDTQRGFKIFTARAAEDIFPRITIYGWGFDIEALALARKFGHKIKEVPIRWRNDPNSHVGLKAYLQVLTETVMVRLNLMTGKYNHARMKKIEAK